MMTMASARALNVFLASLPLIVPCILLVRLLGNPVLIVKGWIDRLGGKTATDPSEGPPPVASQLLAYLLVAVLGFMVTNRLVPNIRQYTLRKGISGKDLGKKGTSSADKDM
jgi:hypothetical protein